MYTIKIDFGGDVGEVTLTTEVRSQARAVELVCDENKVACEVTVEVTPRVVKCKKT